MVSMVSDAKKAGLQATDDLSKQLVASGALDQLFAKIDSGEIEMSGDGGFINALIKAALERGLQAELARHLGYEKGDNRARYYPNSRNGTTPKTLASNSGDVHLDVPRDRNGTFEPVLVPKGSRRIGGLSDMIISLYAGGMTIREIEHHLATTIGTELSHETISRIVDEIADEVVAWQNRPLDPFYPVLYLDAIVLKIKDGAHVRNKAAHIAIGVDIDGIKHVLGIWIENTEGAKFWASVCANLANRGVKDVLIVCTDGLKGFPEAIEATWPDSLVQTCTVHLIRASMRFVSYKDRKQVVAALKPIYTAANEDAALMALEELAESPLGKHYPHVVATWQNAWDRFTPFLGFPPAVRHVIYTTNAIESMNYQLRKITKNRGHFPNDEAALKLMWLAITNVEAKRAREREKNQHKTRKKLGEEIPRMVEGQRTANWPLALQQLALIYPERMNKYIY